jgi:KDO2-lipid IV(A) lauroyltransferase
LGKLIGLALLKLPTNRKHIAKRNIELCFPELNSDKQAALLRDNFISMGIAIMELGMAWWWSKRRFSKLVQFEGLDNLSHFNGQGVILLSIHHTTLEVGAAAIAMVSERDGMYRAHGNPVYDYMQIKGRLHKSSEESRLFERRDVRGTMKALKAGRTVWYAPDQDYGIKQGVFAPFFGIQAATVYATARLAEKTGARVVPFTHIRLPGNQGYKVCVHPALENFPTGDDIADATRINGLVEQFIRQQPDQYLWAHRRFKTRPAGEPDFYTKIQ